MRKDERADKVTNVIWFLIFCIPLLGVDESPSCDLR